MPVIDLSGDLVAKAPNWTKEEESSAIHEVQSYMYFPEDADKRREFLVTERRYMKESDTDFLRVLENTRESRYKQPGEYASTAGFILLTLRQIHEQHPKYNASLNRAMHVVTKLQKISNRDKNTKFIGNRTNAKKAWENYKSVAHFWAAIGFYEILKRPLPFHFAEFLQVSEGMRIFGSNFIPKRGASDRPLLDVNQSWQFPSNTALPLVRVDLPKIHGSFEDKNSAYFFMSSYNRRLEK